VSSAKSQSLKTTKIVCNSCNSIVQEIGQQKKTGTSLFVYPLEFAPLFFTYLLVSVPRHDSHHTVVGVPIHLLSLKLLGSCD